MKRVLIIGDSCRDIYTCTTKRLSPEKPVPVLEIEYIHSVGGMAMNVYSNMISMLPQRRWIFSPMRIGMMSSRRGL